MSRGHVERFLEKDIQLLGKKGLDSVEVMRWGGEEEKSPQLTLMSCEKVQKETLEGFYNHTKPRKEHLTH